MSLYFSKTIENKNISFTENFKIKSMKSEVLTFVRKLRCSKLLNLIQGRRVLIATYKI